MKYGFLHSDNTIIVLAADTLEEFELGREENIDIMDRLTIRELSNVEILPYRVTDESAIAVYPIVTALDLMDDMITCEKHRLEIEAPDRRTLAEIHDLEENDPWAKNDEEHAESRKAMNEQMKKIRDAGGLTDDSFGGSMQEGVQIRGIDTVITEQDVTVKATAIKSTLSAYELVAQTDFDNLLNIINIPENRVDEMEEGRMVVRLHSFQTKVISQFLERENVEFSLVRLTVDKENPFSDFTRGDTSQSIYFCAIFENSKTADRVVSGTIAQHDHEGSAWYVFLRKADAIALIDPSQGDQYVMATNRDGLPIIGKENGVFGVVDTGAEIKVIDPRPWNDRANELTKMSEEELTELWKKFSYSEYIFCAISEGKSTDIYITPATYFEEHETFWDGELYIRADDLKTTLRNQIKPHVFRVPNDRNTALHLMHRAGLEESIALHLHVNELLDQQYIDMRT